MNVYDFDGTIYRGDSTRDFLVYLLIHRLGVILPVLPRMIGALVRHVTGRIDTDTMKSLFFSFLPSEIPYLTDDLNAFWEGRACFEDDGGQIFQWYADMQQPDDVIISASPAFLLAPACARLGIKSLIATDMDPSTGLIRGINCKGPEKQVRFWGMFPGVIPDMFCSDSASDGPMAALAKSARSVVRGQLLDGWIWDIGGI